MGGDKPGIAPHQLDHPDPLGRPQGFDMGAADGPGRAFHGRFKTEGFFHQGDIIVDGLGDADDRGDQPAPLNFLGDQVGPPQGAVPADGKEDIDVELLQGIDDFLDLILAPGRGKDRPPQFVDGGNPLRVQVDHRVVVGRDEALIAIGDADDVVHPVNIIEFQDNGPDDIIQSRDRARRR